MKIYNIVIQPSVDNNIINILTYTNDCHVPYVDTYNIMDNRFSLETDDNVRMKYLRQCYDLKK